MKYVILIGDGMAGYPLESLGNKTTLEYAQTPNIDKLAGAGKLGLVQNVPAGMKPGSDVANISIFGYDPRAEYTGRAPLEAVAMGITLAEHELAFRCNLVTLENNIMKDFTAGHISNRKATAIIRKLNEQLNIPGVKFYPGVSYRHLCVMDDQAQAATCTPPHDITDQETDKYLPVGAGSDKLKNIMQAARPLINSEDTAATDIWLWGQGKAPALKTIKEKFGLTGSVVTAVDLLKGMAKSAGLDALEVEGATGFIDTNYAGKVSAGLQSLQEKDLLILHIEAPDECGHMGDAKLKVQAIEDFDSKVVGPIIAGLQKTGEPYRIIVLPDHPTPVKTKTHSDEPVPFVFFDSNNHKTTATPIKYCEKTAQASGFFIPNGSQLLEKMINANF